MNGARCTIGLLTWNAGEQGSACIESIRRQTEPVAVDWTDNGSRDGTPRRLAELWPDLPEPFINRDNLGFCAGHNQMLRTCRTPYYLALNQDAVLAPDYVARLCDWMDATPRLALASGLILWGETAGAVPEAARAEDRVYSAGLVWPRVRFPFELGMGRPAAEAPRARRRVPAVTGSAMLMRVAACREVAVPRHHVFPADFFAYHEELDLALRLARTGWECGVDGAALAWHAGGGSGGMKRRMIRARYFANHWLVSLRNEPWSALARELPYLLRGELQYWLPRYVASPLAVIAGATRALRRMPRARRFYREFEIRFGPSAERVEFFGSESLRLLRDWKSTQEVG